MTILRTDIPFLDRDRPVITSATDRSARRLPFRGEVLGSRSRVSLVLSMVLLLAAWVGAVQAEEDVSLLQDGAVSTSHCRAM